MFFFFQFNTINNWLWFLYNVGLLQKFSLAHWLTLIVKKPRGSTATSTMF